MNPRQKHNLLAVLSGQQKGVIPTLQRAFLRILEPGFALGVYLRNRAYDRGYFTIRPLRRTTISIGNITTGGTGKTPIVIDLAKRLIARGKRPAVLLRGYHSSNLQESDEAQVLRNELGSGVPVEPNPNRVNGAAAVLQREPATDVFILDDGFQHRKVHRDLNIVLIDATQPWGYGHMLPRGFMREPRSSLRRADGIIITRGDQVSPVVLQALEEQINHLTGEPVLAIAKHVWTGWRDEADQVHPLTHLSDLSVLGVAGIGNPEAFWNMLEAQSREISPLSFDDHQQYDATMLREQIFDIAKTIPGCGAIVTTEKDWVKWKPLIGNITRNVPIFRPILGIEYLRREREVEELLGEIMIVK